MTREELIKRYEAGERNFRGADLSKVNLKGVNLRGASFSWADLEGINLEGANLQGAELWRANLIQADLQGACLRGANLQGAELWKSDLRWIDLRGADLHGADLDGADLRFADLREANLQRARLWKTDLREANLHKANLTETTLCQSVIDGARVRPEDIGGPGHILCALTEDEWDLIKKHRGEKVMSDTSPIKRVGKARKTHVCDWCYELIDAGQPYDWYFVFGENVRVKMHPECLQAMFKSYLPDELLPEKGEVGRGERWV